LSHSPDSKQRDNSQQHHDSKQPFGLSVALTTAFDDSYKIDVERTLAHAKTCLAAGCGSVTLFGTTGEGASIGTLERDRVLDAFVASGVPAHQIIIGVMESAVMSAATQISQALQRGCKAIMLAPPFYYKNISEDGLFAWFSAVFAEVGSNLRDIILYNIPSLTAVELPIALISRLRAAFGAAILGVKDSSGNWDYTQKLLSAHKDCAILIGDERHLAHGVRLGGQGAISGMANLCAPRLLSLIETGQDDKALSTLIDRMSPYSITPAIKAVIAHVKHDTNWVRMRPPLAGISTQNCAELAQLYDGAFVVA